MSHGPRVSVVVHFLNAKKFIREALDSVFAQSYQDWELLLVDDGSTDGSTEIALHYRRRNPERVRYLIHPGRENRGMSASRNLAVKNAKGEYIAFLDADDVWLPRKLEMQVARLDACPAASMIFGITEYWYSWTGRNEDVKRDLLIHPGVDFDTTIPPPALLIRFLRDESPIPCPSDILVRRQTVNDVGGFEESFRRVFTDQVFYAKLLLRASAMACKHQWLRYRRHPESAVSLVKKRGELQSARWTYLNWLEGYLRQQSVEDKELWSALKRAKMKCRFPRWFSLLNHVRYRGQALREQLRRTARVVLPTELHRQLRARWHSAHRSQQAGQATDPLRRASKE